jgi:hypothetical protein
MGRTSHIYYCVQKLSRACFSQDPLYDLIQLEMIDLNYARHNVLSYSHLLFYCFNPRFLASHSGFSHNGLSLSLDFPTVLVSRACDAA